MVEEESPKEEEVKVEVVASPTSQEADFDDYNSPEPKMLQSSDLKSSKVKEVRINEAENTEAPARKLNLEEESADEKKSPAVQPLPLCPYARERVLAEEAHQRRRDEYYARIQADREAAMARHEQRMADEKAARDAAIERAENARAEWDAEVAKRRAAYEERCEAERQAALKQREEYELAANARAEAIAARVAADREEAEAKRAEWEAEYEKRR